MNIWINILHNPERDFWQTMTPYRCAVLYKEYFKFTYPEIRTNQDKKVGLLEYVTGRK